MPSSDSGSEYLLHAVLRLSGTERAGLLNSKGISNTKANIDGRDLKKFLVVRPGGFVFNHRVHDKLGLGYNTSNEVYLFTNDYVAFYIKPEIAGRVLLPDYLYMWFLRSEFDRYMLFKTYGSATLFFNWENMCELEITLPDVLVQQKYVDIYKAMIANQQSYERGLEDLKLVCDGYIEDLRRRYLCEKIGSSLIESDQRNTIGLSLDSVRGIATSKELIPTKANMDGVSLDNYKIVNPRQFAYVADTSRRGDRISLGLNDSQEPFLVSSISTVFGTREEHLLPEYLMLYFTRAEFDRYTRFNSWGSARETFDWSEMCNVEIPIPDINVQKAIAQMYGVYTERKKINEQLKAQIKDTRFEKSQDVHVDRETIDEIDFFSSVIHHRTQRRDLKEYYRSFGNAEEARCAKLRFEIMKLENKNTKRWRTIEQSRKKYGSQRMPEDIQTMIGNCLKNIETDNARIQAMQLELEKYAAE